MIPKPKPICKCGREMNHGAKICRKCRYMVDLARIYAYAREKKGQQQPVRPMGTARLMLEYNVDGRHRTQDFSLRECGLTGAEFEIHHSSRKHSAP